MSIANKNVQLGIYLCDCDGKVSQKYDLNKIKTVIQSGADFEYIRVTDTICGKLEQEKLAKEIERYSLNRLLFVGCQDPFIKRHLIALAEEAGVSRYEVVCLDLDRVCSQQTTEAAIAAINQTLAQMQLRVNIGMEEVKVEPEVLVIGAGLEGAATALAIAKQQPVTVVDQGLSAVEGPSLSGRAGIKVLEEAKLTWLEGFPGRFNVEIEHEGQIINKIFGAVVLAPEARPVFDASKYGGIELGDQVLSLSQFINSNKQFSGQKVTFILGKADQDSLLSSAIAVKNSIKLLEKGASAVNIFYQDMKISADGLEQDYQQARARGVNFLKYKGELKYSTTQAMVTVEYEEPFLHLPAKINSDYLVLAEDFTPAPVTAELAELMKLNLGPGGFFQEDNVHFLPIKSNREGIFLVGSCHGPIYATELNKEVEAVAAETGRFISGKVSVPSLQPRVEAEKCAVCLTCYRCCPHHAIEIVHDESLNNMYHSAARMDPLACRHCGICAGECPGKAIQLPIYSDQEILQEIAQPPAIVAYVCENSGALAAEFAKELEPKLQAELQIVKVPCSGKIDALYLLKALERGAQGVMLCVCHQENCKYVWGNERAEKRKDQVRTLLKNAGLEDDRVELFHVAANQGNQFNTAIKEMADKLNQLGNIPGKVRK